MVSRRSMVGAICALAAAGTTWVMATEVVVVYPAEIRGTIIVDDPDFVPTSFRAVAYSSTSGAEIASKSFSAPDTGYSLVVEGGNPADATNEGYDYRLQHTLTQSTPDGARWITIDALSDLHVQNSPAAPSVVVHTFVDLPALRRITAELNVLGGTVTGYTLYAWAPVEARNENHTAYRQTWSIDAASVSDWLAFAPAPSVLVYGSATVKTSGNSSMQVSLSQKTVDLSSSNAQVAWDIDLTNLGIMQGVANYTAPASSPDVSVYLIRYSKSGTSGMLWTYPPNGLYSAELAPGDYVVQPSVYTGSAYGAAAARNVSILAGTTTTENFLGNLGRLHAPVTLTGLVEPSEISAAWMAHVRQDPAPNHGGTASSGGSGFTGTFELAVPEGHWFKRDLQLGIYNLTNPELPLNGAVYRYYHENVPELGTVVAPGGASDLPGETLTLVKANLYLDVIEPANTPPITIKSPEIYLYRHSLAPSTVRQAYFYGSAEARERSALTVVAEPGVYALDARAYIDGTRTRFGSASSTIRFGAPIATPVPPEPGAPQKVEFPPSAGNASQVVLEFEDVTEGGYSTVVESPLGPPPPEGFKLACVNEECTPTYYDIQTSAKFNNGVRVCIRTVVWNEGVPNSGEFLTLGHYDTTVDDWVPLEDISVFDCSEDFAQCGCEDPLACGLQEDVFGIAFKICGTTTSFSPFALLQQRKHFVATSTGPTGAIQTWTVPATGRYTIEAIGAAGATPTASTAAKGGCGAKVAGDFQLQQGDVLQLLVGQRGTAALNSGGGGGGSFVVRNGAPLLVAGGGGGIRAGATVDGRAGSLGMAGVAGATSGAYTSGFIAGGTNGAGGARMSSYGAGGGGWSGDGAADGTYGDGGAAFLRGGLGGTARACSNGLAHGGFGGGGSGNGCYGGGGGGGYSGGGGGRVGGGGGSWNAGTNQSGTAGVCTGDGHGAIAIGPGAP